jgi:hypothetical protein
MCRGGRIKDKKASPLAVCLLAVHHPAGHHIDPVFSIVTHFCLLDLSGK